MSGPPVPDDASERDLIEHLRAVKEQAREVAEERPKLPASDEATEPTSALPPVEAADRPEPSGSPARDDLNRSWDVAAGFTDPPSGTIGRLLKPFRGPLQRLVRFALGPVVERQVTVNAAQVRFDNEIVAYVDARLDRIERHYDDVLGKHGKRMEEIDERHLILQQELIRHVHDLVERIEFVFENAETNHLQVDAVVRDTREELKKLAERIEALGAPSRPGR